MNKTLDLFAKTAFVEGISCVLLFFVAMPLKYFFNYPLAVKYVGWAHGVLFLAYVALLLLCWMKYSWSFKRVLFFFIASLLPFLAFVVEKQIKKEAH